MSDYVLPANAPLPGEMFAERYRIDRILGVGGMGFVVAATHVHLHEKVAIKMLLPELASNKQTVERFLREGRAAVKIRSEHVARVLDVGELAADRTPYLVMEYLDGCDLALYLESNGKVEPAKAVAWVLEACEAIAEAHAMKTVHRDLKPANLFLAQQPNGGTVIKVLDFGISKMTGIEKANLSMTKTSAMLGSPLYMSPEQLRSARNVDERSDIWSIGVILYELIVGHPPYFAETLAELGALVLTGETPRVIDAVETVPVELSDLIATCMQKKAEDRFVNLADFATAIASFGAEGSNESAQNIVKTLGGMPKSRAPIASSSLATTGPAQSGGRSGSNPSLTPLVRTQPLRSTPAPAEKIDPRSDPRIVAADTVDMNLDDAPPAYRAPPSPRPTPPGATPFSGYGVTASGIVAPKKARIAGVLAGVAAFIVIGVGGAVLVYKQAQVAPAAASTITADHSTAAPVPTPTPTPTPTPSPSPLSASTAAPEASASAPASASTAPVASSVPPPVVTPKPTVVATPVTPKLTPAATARPGAPTPTETVPSLPIASAPPPPPASPTPTSSATTKPKRPPTSQIATDSKD